MMWMALGLLWGSIFCATGAVDLAARAIRARRHDRRNALPEIGGAVIMGILSLIGFANLYVMVTA